MKINARTIRVFYASSNFLRVNNELTARENNYFLLLTDLVFGFNLSFHDIFYNFVSLTGNIITMGKTKPTAFIALISLKNQHDYLEAIIFAPVVNMGFCLPPCDT